MNTNDQLNEPTPRDFLQSALRRYAQSKEQIEEILIGGFIEDFHSRFVEVLSKIPDGPAKMTHAYILTTCDYVQEIAEPTRAMLATLFTQPGHQATWAEFVDVACTSDTISSSLQRTCRYIAAGLWLEGVLFGAVSSQKINEVKRFTDGLSLMESCLNATA